MKEKNLRIYVHWPFCLFKCPYCDFNSHEISRNNVSSKEAINLWLESYLKEIKFYKNFLIDSKIQSIYFGGGTPSLMDPKIIEAILNSLKSFAFFDPEIEITLEANPTSIEISKFREFKNAGINRVSIGIQSLRPELLKFLGRQHSLPEALKALETANEVFGKRFSFDLMYGLPGQKPSEWAFDLERIFGMNFENQHISLYQLTIEKGTKFFSMHESKKFEMPDENLQSEFYDLTKKICGQYGFEAYEISNYAKSGEFKSRHNLGYWNYENYLGIGPGAHSRMSLSNHSKICAFFDVYKPENWLKAINDENYEIEFDLNFEKRKPNFVQSFEILENEKILEEMILMGLRTKTGLSLQNLQQKFGPKIQFNDLIDYKIISNLEKNGFLDFNQEFLFLTEKGLKVSDFIIRKICNNFSLNKFKQ